MIRIILAAIAAVALAVAWAALVFVGSSAGWGKSPLAKSNDATDFVRAARQIVETNHAGNFSMLVLEDWKTTQSYNFSTGQEVGARSVFQVASLGKWVAAWGVMALVQDGTLDLDQAVSGYLTRWQLPPSEFDNSGVTVRRLLSHTAGLDDGLGYDGFATAAEVQTLEASLTRAGDASPGKNGVVKLGAKPGGEWQYSGGGYTLLQLLIEEVSQQTFADFMAARVFGPLGMHRTTFHHDKALSAGLAENFNLAGEAEPYRWYAALAATSLFTTTEDLAIFVTAHSGASSQSVLSMETLALMRAPHASQMGADIWGLGAMLYAPNNRGAYIVGHDGSNGPAINTVARFDPDTGNGIVILATGSETLATQIAGEWVFWTTGNIDSLMFLMGFDRMLVWMGLGSGVILILGFFAGFRLRKAQQYISGVTELDLK